MALTTLPDLLQTSAARGISLPLLPTNDLIAELMNFSAQVTDLVFSPMRPAQVMLNGELFPVELPGLPALIPADTERIAGDLLANSPVALERLRQQGSCEFSFYLANYSRFRVSILAQRGSYAVAMRVVLREPPTLSLLGLPPSLTHITAMNSGLVLVTGPSGSGKSTTLAALVHGINEAKPVQIITIENPIEYQHQHLRATVLQRELYRDVPDFPTGIRAASRQPSQVLMLSELGNRECVELALEAVQAGQLVLSSMNTPRIAEGLERLQALFPPAEQPFFRARLARSLRCVVSQRLLPLKTGAGRAPLCEILFVNAKTRGRIEKVDTVGKVLSYAMREGAGEGMQCFEDALAYLLETGKVDLDTAQRFAGDILAEPLESAPAPRKPGSNRNGA
jgi:twitching motility protein PilT